MKVLKEKCAGRDSPSRKRRKDRLRKLLYQKTRNYGKIEILLTYKPNPAEPEPKRYIGVWMNSEICCQFGHNLIFKRLNGQSDNSRKNPEPTGLLPSRTKQLRVRIGGQVSLALEPCFLKIPLTERDRRLRCRLRIRKPTEKAIRSLITKYNS